MCFFSLPSTCLSICLSTYLSSYLSICPSIFYPFVDLSIYVSMPHLYLSFQVGLFVCSFVCWFVCLLPVCIFSSFYISIDFASIILPKLSEISFRNFLEDLALRSLRLAHLPQLPAAVPLADFRDSESQGSAAVGRGDALRSNPRFGGHVALAQASLQLMSISSLTSLSLCNVDLPGGAWEVLPKLQGGLPRGSKIRFLSREFLLSLAGLRDLTIQRSDVSLETCCQHCRCCCQW